MAIIDLSSVLTKSVTESQSYGNVNSLVRTPSTNIDIFSISTLSEIECQMNRDSEKFYKTILESEGNEEVIQEGFKDFIESFKQWIKTIIEKIHNTITALINKIKGENRNKKKDTIQDLIKQVNDDTANSVAEEIKFKYNAYDFDNSSIYNKSSQLKDHVSNVTSFAYDTMKGIDLKSVLRDDFNIEKYNNIRDQIDNFDYDNFSYELLSILYKDKKREKDVNKNMEPKEYCKIRSFGKEEVEQEFDATKDLSKAKTYVVGDVLDDDLKNLKTFEKEITNFYNEQLKSVESVYNKNVSMFNSNNNKYFTKQKNDIEAVLKLIMNSLNFVKSVIYKVTSIVMTSVQVETELNNYVFNTYEGIMSKYFKIKKANKNNGSVEESVSYYPYYDSEEASCSCAEEENEEYPTEEDIPEVSEEEPTDDGIPVSVEDIEESNIKSTIRENFNAIDFQDAYNSISKYVDKNSKIHNIIKLESTSNPNLGKDILGTVYANRIRNLTEEAIGKDEKTIEANKIVYQSIYTQTDNKDDLEKFDVLIKASDIYLEQLNLHKTTKSNVNKNVDYMTESTLDYYKAHKLYSTNKHVKFINECLLMSSDKPSNVVLNELQKLNEDFSDKVGSFVDKVKNVISEIWDKFVEEVDYFTSNNKKYLDKYKSTIVDKNPTFPVTMKKYEDGIEKIKSVEFPEYNYEQLKEYLKDKDTFQSYVLKNTQPGFKSGDDFDSYCLNLFTGGAEETELSESELAGKMKDIFEYCYGYGEIKNNLKSDKDKIMSSIDNAKKDLDNSKVEDTKKETSTTNKEDNQNKNDEPVTTTKTENFLFGKSNKYVFTEVYGLISEVDFGEVKKEENPTDDDNKTPENTNLKESIEIYNNTARSFFAAKLKAARVIYGDYMKVIKHHVDMNK